VFALPLLAHDSEPVPAQASTGMPDSRLSIPEQCAKTATVPKELTSYRLLCSCITE